MVEHNSLSCVYAYVCVCIHQVMSHLMIAVHSEKIVIR